MSDQMLKAALEYAKRGWLVFPLHSPQGKGCSCGDPECTNAGKHPRTQHGFKDATSDEATIRQWWGKWPDANIGVPTGAKLVVLDVDPRHGGDTTLRDIERTRGPLPKGPRTRTGGGGSHILFENVGHAVKSKAGIAAGLDVRGGGGYFVAPPSRHVSGKRYQWLRGLGPHQTPLPKLPDWIRELTAGKAVSIHTPDGERIQEGKRNTALTSLAGAMRKHGASEAAILSALQKYNEERCNPPLPDKEVATIASSVSRYQPAEKSPRGQRSKLATLFAKSLGVKLFHTPDMETYAAIKINDHWETRRLKEPSFKRWLASRFFKASGEVPSTHVLNDTLAVLEGGALFEGPEHEVFTRIATLGADVYLDLCDEAWRAVRITSKGWEVVASPPVHFRRARGMKPLPLPARGGSVKGLQAFLNLASAEDFALLVGWLVTAFNPRGPYPALVLQGEAGSAKSTTAKLLRELFDPNTAPLRAEPREVRDLMIAARNAWCVAFDNVSRLTPWLSDTMCRLATGGGFATRELYTDDQEALFEATRPVLLNGIEGLVTRGDLLDRALVVYLPVIPEDQRKPERDFWKQFRSAQPSILGALLDAVSCALRRLPTVRLAELPRMADFALWVTAAEPALPWAKGFFMQAYNSNRVSANSLTLEASPIVTPLRRVSAGGYWSGTAAELLRKLSVHANYDDDRRDWPKSPWKLAVHLRQIAPNLRATGLDVRFGKTAGRGSRRVITLTVQPPEVATIPNATGEMPNKSEESEGIRASVVTIQRFPRTKRFPRLRQRFPRLDPAHAAHSAH